MSTFQVAGTAFPVLADPTDGPRLSAVDARFEALTIAVGWATEGQLGDPCTVAARVRAGEPLAGALCSIDPAEPDEPDLERAWRDGDEPLCRVSVWIAGHPPSVLASRERVALVYERFVRARLDALSRWVFREQPAWCEPAPGEQDAVGELEQLSAAVTAEEPVREPSAAYDAWLLRSDALLAGLIGLGLASGHAPLPYKAEFLDRWGCTELAAWYAAAAARDRWATDRFAAGPVQDHGWPPPVSSWLFRFQERPPVTVLAAAERQVRTLDPTAGCGSLVVDGHRVFWRRELGRPVVVSVAA